jgi:hypothetical protein
MSLPPLDGAIWEPVRRASRAAIALVCHTALAALVVVAIKLLEWLLHFLWGATDPLLFDRFPIRYLFDAMDGGVILVFVCYGIIEAFRAFRS